MKLRNSWDGITIEVGSTGSKPLFDKKRWEGPTQRLSLNEPIINLTEDTKVLMRDETVNIGSVKIVFGKIDFDIEMSMEEGIQGIKSIAELSKTIRNETLEWLKDMKTGAVLINELMSKINNEPEPEVTPAPDPEAEPTVEPTVDITNPTVAQAIAAGIAKAMETIKNL